MKPFTYIERIGLCFILTMLLGSFFFFFLYALPLSRGQDSYIGILSIFSGYGLLYLGMFSLLLRIIRILRNNISFFYLMVAVANIYTGILSAILYFLGKINLWWFDRCLLNLIVGVVILADGWLFRVSNNEKAN